jgi:hypothetical protein
MKKLLIASTGLAGMLAAVTSLADQGAKVVDTSADYYTLSTNPAGLRQLSDDQLREITAGDANKGMEGSRYHYTANELNKIKFLEGSVVRKPN